MSKKEKRAVKKLDKLSKDLSARADKAARVVCHELTYGGVNEDTVRRKLAQYEYLNGMADSYGFAIDVVTGKVNYERY